MVTMDKTTRAARISSVKIPYSRARLAVARVVDIWAMVITPIPQLVLKGKPISRAYRKPLTDLLVIKEITTKPVKRASPGAKSVAMFVDIPRLSRKMWIKNP